MVKDFERNLALVYKEGPDHITTNTETFEERDRKQSGRNKGMGGEGEKHSFLQKAFMKGIGQSHSTDKRK